MNAGAAYIYEQADGTWTQTAKLIGSTPGVSGWVGRSVAIDGDLVVIGGNRYEDNTGVAYIFARRADGTWREDTRLGAQIARTSDNFGVAVAIDGTTAVVGTPLDDAGGDQNENSGAVYVFVRNGQTWSRVRIAADDGERGDYFGIAVDVDGDRIVVGAQRDSPGGERVGAAYVFRRNGAGWTQEAKLVADDALEGDLYGRSVAIDGDRVLVGAPTADATRDGAVYVFARDGQTWTQQARIVAQEATGSDDVFGIDVSLAGDRAVIGANGASPSGTNTGAAYTFVESGGSWAQEAILVPAGGAARDDFGFDVAIGGSRVIVGALETDGTVGLNSGAAYIFAITAPVATDLEGETGLDLEVYPNPASSRTTVALEVAQPGTVRVAVYDVLGREVTVAFEGAVSSRTSIDVDTSRLTPGAYVVRVAGEGFVATRRLTVTR